MRIYISGKISGLPMDEARMSFMIAKAYVKLANRGADVVNPFDLRPFLGIKTLVCYMITDLWQLRKCTHIVMQKNWIESKGCHWEHYFAKFIFKIKVIYL